MLAYWIAATTRYPKKDSDWSTVQYRITQVYWLNRNVSYVPGNAGHNQIKWTSNRPTIYLCDIILADCTITRYLYQSRKPLKPSTYHFFPRLSSSTGSEMRFPRLPYSLAALALGSLLTRADMGSYFEFVQPTTGTEWVNGEVHPIIWEKGLLDGVGMFDLELARLSQDGIIKAALNVPANAHYMNVFIQDVPAADDYYLLFINSTHGGMYAISPRFTILEAGSSIQNASASAEAAVATATTLTISGGPNPTAVFATTFPAIDSGVQAWRLDSTARASTLGIMCAGAAVVLGAAWTVL
ncbi:hypothetical protein ACEPAF_8924 [Sanghuangporus sanghuang]